MNAIGDHGKTAIDVGAGIVTVGTVANWLPVFVSVLAAIWYLIRIGEWAYDKYKKYREKHRADV